MPEPAHITPVGTDFLSGPGFSKMPDHIISILTGVIDSLPAGGLKGYDALFASGYINHLSVLLLTTPGSRDLCRWTRSGVSYWSKDRNCLGGYNQGVLGAQGIKTKQNHPVTFEAIRIIGRKEINGPEGDISKSLKMPVLYIFH
jgi:hypothetical protein